MLDTAGKIAEHIREQVARQLDIGGDNVTREAAGIVGGKSRPGLRARRQALNRNIAWIWPETRCKHEQGRIGKRADRIGCRVASGRAPGLAAIFDACRQRQ